MRPFGTSEQLERRRQRALELLAKGKTVNQVARQVGTTIQSVYRWQREQKRPKKPNATLPGKPTYLSKDQIHRLRQELLRGAYAHGYSEDYWTLDRIRHVIWEQFKVRYTTSGVWRLMDRMDWSSQKVQRLAIRRDDEQIANWNRRVWPRIEKVA
ncbi:MAG TPA: winged helix-turn-helix domain-containing protein [Anaerolineales bacterium]|nr:winged helix-turn-helix domain-containing protein [Anaerolineales bacterium]